MRTRLAVLAVLAVPFAVASAAVPVQSPLAGRWSLDIATLAMPVEARPKSVILDFHPTDDGKWATRVEIVDPTGREMSADATLALDGTPGPATGSYGADVSAVKMPEPNVLVMQLADDGVPASTRIYTVSEDGRTMTETKAFFSHGGDPILMTSRFNRMP